MSLPHSFPKSLQPYRVVEVVPNLRFNPYGTGPFIQYGLIDKYGRSRYHTPSKSNIEEVARRANSKRKEITL